MEKLERYLRFIREAERLKDVLRTAHTSTGRHESTAEHSWRLALLAAVLTGERPRLDMQRVLLMCLVHDLDTGFYQTTMAGGGFDHCYVLDRPRGASQSLCAWASSDKTGISMKMYTTQPGIQLYTGNFLQNCPSPGKGGVPLEKYGGFALETQHFPCSPSHPEFPTTVLRAGKVFRANTTLRFFTGRQCGRL